MKTSRLIALSIMSLFFLLPPMRLEAFSGKDAYPKTANAFLRWKLDAGDLAALSKFDILILDMENQENNPEMLKSLRQLNPSIILLAYVSSQEIRYDTALYPELKLRQKMFKEIPDSWYLRSASNSKVSFWPDTWMINISKPSSSTAPFADYLASFISNDILGSGLWDGVFYDNLWDSVSWLNQGDIDLDQDGVAETAEVIDGSWQAGVIALLDKTRQLSGWKPILIANSSDFPAYQPYLNGVMFENFPKPWDGSKDWGMVMESISSLKLKNVQPHIYILNSTENKQSDYGRFRFTLASALLADDAYASFDKSVSDHGQAWLYDEYSFYLGQPAGPAYPILTEDNYQGLWRRDFKNGSVLLNSGLWTRPIRVGTGLKRLSAVQDPSLNNGQKLDSLSLPPESGIILEKDDSLAGLNLKVGHSYSFFDFQGHQVRTIRKALLPANPKIMPLDLAQKAKLKLKEAIFGKKSLISLYSDGKKLSFEAYPEYGRVGVKAIAGDFDGDKRLEIATLPAKGPAKVKIFDLKGKKKSEFFAAPEKWQGIAELRTADIDNDSYSEILISIDK